MKCGASVTSLCVLSLVCCCYTTERFWDEGKNTSGNCIVVLWKFSQLDRQQNSTWIQPRGREFHFHLSPWLQSLCFDPCFIFRCWRVSQSACKQISAFTSTRTCSTAARPFEEPLKAACGPWPCGSRPPTHPRETHSSTAETCWPCSTLSPVAPLRSSKMTSWWPSWVSPLGLRTQVHAEQWSKSWSYREI